LRKVANRQTDNDDYTSSLSEVMNYSTNQSIIPVPPSGRHTCTP